MEIGRPQCSKNRKKYNSDYFPPKIKLTYHEIILIKRMKKNFKKNHGNHENHTLLHEISIFREHTVGFGTATGQKGVGNKL